MKRKIALLTAICLLTGCSSSGVNSLNAADAGQTLELPELSQDQQDEIARLVRSDNKDFMANGWSKVLTDDEWEEVLTAFARLQGSKKYYSRDMGGKQSSIYIVINGERHTITRSSGRENYLMVDGTSEYAYTNEFAEIFQRYCDSDENDAWTTDSVSIESVPDRLIGLSVECSEPKTHEEYLTTARAVVAQWLDTLKTETGRYHLDSYKFTDKLADNRVFHGDGYVNGGREFVCYVGFDTPTKDENTAFYASGTYDEFYHYYFGPGVLARFRWENGVCTLTDYDKAYAMLTSDRLKDGLFGIGSSDMKYKTFYDFMNDRSSVSEWLDKEYASYLCDYVVSHNVMMLSNGDIVYMDIGNSSMPDVDGDYVTTDMHQYFHNHTNEKNGYSSPVDYVDGVGAVTMTYRNGFSMVYDDYNHDGNPDYAIRISTDGKGSLYDVRCMDISGYPFEDSSEIYIYGETDESIRLQVADSGALLIPYDDGNGGIAYAENPAFSDKGNTSRPQVTDGADTGYRMYSQKFFLPENLRCYTADDTSIICYFWNNTSASVTVGGAYEIQRQNGENWETVASGVTSSSTVNANSSSEISFDISGINSDEMAVYRIKTEAGGSAVYGGFFYGTETAAKLEISSEKFPSFVDSISFEVTNAGMSVAFPKAALYLGGEKLCDVSLDKINSGDSRTVVIPAADVGGKFTAGEYTLTVSTDGRDFSGTAEVADVSGEKAYFFAETVPAKMEYGSIVLSLTNNIWNEKPVTIRDIGAVTIMDDNNSSAAYMCDDFTETELAYGDTLEIRLKDYSDYLTEEYKKVYDEIKGHAEYAGILGEDLDISAMSFDEFFKEFVGIGTVSKGDLCRVPIYYSSDDGTGEYVYFKMP